MRRTALIILTATALVAGACADDVAPDTGQVESPTPAGSPTTTAPTGEPATPTASPADGATDVTDLTFTTCEAERVSVEYPVGWWTNPGDDAPRCRLFHPDQVEVTPESLHYAVQLYLDEVPFERATDRADEQDEVLAERTTTVDGHQALVQEVRESGSGLAPRGTLTYSWIVDLDGEILWLGTHSVGDTDYERDKALVDRMADSVRIEAAASPTPSDRQG